MSYQSPILLDKNNVIYVSQDVHITGVNNGATYDPLNKVFHISDNDEILLIIDYKIYKLIQYHFHVPAEHLICNTHYPSEIHYVFIECNFQQSTIPCNCSFTSSNNSHTSGDGDSDRDSDSKSDSDNSNTSSNNSSINNDSEYSQSNRQLTQNSSCISNNITGNILVIGKLIDNNPNSESNLSTLQIEAPNRFFEYDGTLSTGNYSPVRWIVDDYIIYLNINDIIPISKTDRPLQNLDGRLVLFNC